MRIIMAADKLNYRNNPPQSQSSPLTPPGTSGDTPDCPDTNGNGSQKHHNTDSNPDSATSSQEIDLYGNIDNEFNCGKEPGTLEDFLMDESVSCATDRDRKMLPLPGPSIEQYEREVRHEQNVDSPLAMMAPKFDYQREDRFIYIGNLTWWTTAEDIEEALHNIGIYDLIEVRIVEKKTNGVSKGYCEVTLQTEKSLTEIQQKLVKEKINNRCPFVLPKSQESYAHLENLAIANSSGLPSSNPTHGRGRFESINRQVHSYLRPAASGNGLFEPNSAFPNGDMRNFPNRPPDNGVAFQPPVARNYYSTRPYGSSSFNGSYQPRQQMYRPRYGSQQYSRNNGDFIRGNIRNQFQMNAPAQTSAWRPPIYPVIYTGPFPPGGRPPLIASPPGPQLPMPILPMPMGAVARTSPPECMADSRDGNGYRDRNRDREFSPARTPPPDPKITEAYEDLMARNRIVSGTAIERAVKDAGDGDYGSAVETLVTAISLLKQSKVASDDRCKILIASLQDTLHGVESRSYGGHRRRSRSRSRSQTRHHSSSSHIRYFHDEHGYTYPHRSRGRERKRSRSRSPSRVSRNSTSIRHHE